MRTVSGKWLINPEFNDQIIAVDGRVFPSIAVFGAYIAALAPGSQATVDYMPAGEGPPNAQRVTVALGAAGSSSSGTPVPGLTPGQKVAIGVGAAALLGCYEMGCFSPRRTTGQPPARPSPLPGR